MIKKKSAAMALLISVLLVIATIFCFGMGRNTMSASAATYSDSGRYKLEIDAKMSLSVNTEVNYEAYIYGTSTSSATTTVSDGAIFKFSPKKLEIVIPKGSYSNYHQLYGRIYDVKISGPVSFSSPNVNNGSTSKDTILTYNLSGLTDGNYTFSFTKDEYYYSSTIGGVTSKYFGKVTETFSFKVDTSGPVITGASTSETGMYVNSSFTVKATDAGSGVSAMYMKAPDKSSYTSVGTSKTVYSGSTNGLYKFYAIDNAGYVSSTYYVYYDNVAPTLKAVTSSGETITSGGTTKDSFSVIASDSGSGLNTLQYKTPTSAWQNYTSGAKIDVKGEQGTYSFKATDKSGNSTTYTVKLDNPCAAGHNYKTEIIAPTCTSGGYTIYTCSGCGDSYISDKTSALGHSYKATTTTGSCTSGGYTTYTCTRCGDSYTDNETAPTGHSFEAKITQPTCTSEGFTTYTCTKCGYSYKGNTTEALGHSFEAVTTASSCTEGGYTTYKCTRCGVSHTDSPTQATGHSYVASVIEATCTERGYTIFTCTKCGDSYRDNETAPLGHNFVEVTKEATCTEYGKVAYTCQVCGYEKSESNGVYPTGHSYANYIVKAPTCTEQGERRFVCDKCGDEYTEVIAATGHSYAITDSTSEDGIIIRTYTCTTCGDCYTEELGDQYEEVSSYVEELFEEYRTVMWWVLLITAGIWSIVMGVFFAIAQKNEEKEKAKKMIVNYVIGLVVIFVILVACPYLVKGIAILVT